MFISILAKFSLFGGPFANIRFEYIYGVLQKSVPGEYLQYVPTHWLKIYMYVIGHWSVYLA